MDQNTAYLELVEAHHHALLCTGRGADATHAQVDREVGRGG